MAVQVVYYTTPGETIHIVVYMVALPVVPAASR